MPKGKKKKKSSISSGPYNVGSTGHPDIRDLNQHVIPNIPADKWEELGAELLDGNTAELSHIRAATSDTPLRCRFMFEKWLSRRNISWDILVSALEKVQLTYLADIIRKKLPDDPDSITDSKQPVPAEHQLGNQKSLQAYSFDESRPLEFSPSTAILIAYTQLSDKCFAELQRMDVDTIKGWCELYSKQVHPESLELDSATSMDILFKKLRNSPYYNCFNLDLVEYLASLSKNQSLIDSVKNYEKTYFNIKLESLVKRNLKVYDGDKLATTEVQAKVKSMTVNELKVFCLKFLGGILYLDAGESLPSLMTPGCVCVTWYIPSSLADHAFHSACMNTKLFSELKVTCVIIGRYRIEPVEKYMGVTPAHILVNHYSLLLQHLQPLKVVEVMMSLSLLSEVDHKITLNAPLDHIRNCYIVEHVRHMNTSKLFTFLDILKEIPDQKDLYNTISSDLKDAGFTCLPVSDDTSDLDSDTDDSSSEDDLHLPSHTEVYSHFNISMKAITFKKQSYLMPDGETTMYFKPNNVVALFVDLFDKLCSLLQSCEVETMVHLLRSLKASDTYNISLFPVEYITNRESFTDIAVLLRTLFPYSNWYDHSIIRELVGACDCPEAERVLDEFDSHIDPTLHITDYPIPVYSSTMIPNKSSTHTVMAVVYNKELSSLPLQCVEVVKSIIVQKFCITRHACLLLAFANFSATILYWLIPKSILSIIVEKVQEYSDDLSTSGILEVAIYQSFIFPSGSTDRVWSSVYSMDMSGMLNQAYEQIQSKETEFKLAEQTNSSLQQELKNLKGVEEEVRIKVAILWNELSKYKCDVKDRLIKMAPSSEVTIPLSTNREITEDFMVMDGLEQIEEGIYDLEKLSCQIQLEQTKQLQEQLQLREEYEQLESRLQLKNKEIELSKGTFSKVGGNTELPELRIYAAKLEQKNKELLGKIDGVKKEVQKEIGMRVANLQYKLSNHEREFKSAIKQIIPDSESLVVNKELKVSRAGSSGTVDDIEDSIDDLEKLLKNFKEKGLTHINQVQSHLQGRIDELTVQLQQKDVQLEKSKEANRHNIEKQDRLHNKLKESEQMGEEFRVSAEKLEKRYNKLQEASEKIREEVEKEFSMKTKGLQQRLNDHKKEIKHTIKQIFPDTQDLPVSKPSIVENVQQLEYDIDDLEKLTKHLYKAEQSKLQQMQVQFQEEVEELDLKLRMKDEELKKSKEDIRQLLKRIAKTKEAKLPYVDDSNLDYFPVKYSLLGGGSYGEVYRVHYKDGLYAGKALHARLLPGYPNLSKEDLSKLLKQFSTKCGSIAGNFSNPNVEQFTDVVRMSADGHLMIITELLNESLTSYLNYTSKSIYTDQKLMLCLDMAQGVHYLHSQSLVHRNLHGGNVLMTSGGHAKIADYLCPLILSDVVGNSSGYVPPEVLQNKPYSNQSNVFSLGVLFLQVITRSPPRPSTDVSTRSEVERRRNDLDSVPNVHPLLSYITKCLNDNVVARPQTRKLCDHINQLITQTNHPKMMAYKLLYTDEHLPLVSSLATKKYQLECTTCQDLPAPMYWAYAVTKGMDVYVTGGNSRNGFAVENILKFNLLKNQWVKLPSSGFHHSVPAIIEGKLSLIGGRRPSNKVAVNNVDTYNEDSGQWESHYPGMIQPRYRPAVVVHDNYVIVLGGKVKERSTMTRSIEVMKIQDQTWTILTTRLPTKMYDMPVTVSQDQVWIVGYDDGSNRGNNVYTIPFGDLISSSVATHSWKEVRRDTVYYKMSVVHQSNPLVVLGGDDRQNKTVSSVLTFDPYSNSWNEVASLSGPRAHCAVAPIGDRAILVIGGCTETKNLKACNSSCLNTVEMYYIK